jgi:hypothetical protein
LLSLIAGLLLSCTTATAAQTNTGEISGVVRDSQGGVLPGTTIVAEHLEGGTKVVRLTDEQGHYLFPSLRVGTRHLRRAHRIPAPGPIGRDRRTRPDARS